MSEKRVGYIVLCQAFCDLIIKLKRKIFRHWAHRYSSRYDIGTYDRQTQAAIDIQRWFRHIQITTRKSWKLLADAIQICIQRRRAIKYLIKVEMTRRVATTKIFKGIQVRRRYYYGARGLERIYKWLLLHRKVTWKLIRNINARKLQRWYRMMLVRPQKEREIIDLIIRCGGYSRVYPKVPKKHMERGLIYGVIATISQIQKSWFASKGQMALFMLFAARRGRMEHEKMLNENATIIQNNWRCHLWCMLTTASITHNRSRRISRGFRAFLYRKWVYFACMKGRNRRASKIQKFLRKRLFIIHLKKRFKLRKALIILTTAKKSISAMIVQRAYRAYKERERIRKEELRKFYAAKRAQAALTSKVASKIQRNWRQMKHQRIYGVKNIIKEGAFPYHVVLVCQRIVRERNYKQWLGAFRLQKIARLWLAKRKELQRKLRILAANIIWRFTKAYLLKLSLWDHVHATFVRRRDAANFLKRNFRNFLFIRFINIRASICKLRWDHEKLVDNSIRFIQEFVHRKMEDYYSAMRVASRKQKVRRREAEAIARRKRLEYKSAMFVTRFFKYHILGWKKTLRMIDKGPRQYYKERKAARKIQTARRMMVQYRWYKKYRQDEKYTWASGIIGFYWRRKKENHTLIMRFKLRRLMIDEYNRLHKLKVEADAIRDEAIEDRERTEENMRATIAAAWRQGSDATGKNYYYNYVTGESSWVPPENWKVKVLDTWLRQIDDRQNVYYYNMSNGESRWLPPCCNCGMEAQRWCADCGCAYCTEDYEKNHDAEGGDATMADHAWSLCEYEKDVLKPGETYCIDCRRRNATKMCTTCWDPYCDECFKHIHHTGALKYHKTIAYKKAKLGWTCVKGSGNENDPDYYVNGMTGETTYEKPPDLMTPQEVIYYENFLEHKKKGEEFIQQIEKLQYDLETVAYDRDTILLEALQGGSSGVAAHLAKKKAKGELDLTGVGTDVLAQTIEKNKNSQRNFISALLFGDPKETREKMLNPDDRRRGKDQSDYLRKLLEETAANERQKVKEAAASKKSK